MTSFVAVVPIDEINVTASDVAIVIRAGIFIMTNMSGTSRKAPPAPTIPV